MSKPVPFPRAEPFPTSERPAVIWLPKERAWFARSVGIGEGTHYRERVPFNAKHAYVYDSDFYVINHYDDFNPDFGWYWEHYYYDVLPGLKARFK